MKTVYIASPYRGDVDNNTRMAKRYCSYAVRNGVIPICPHIYFTNFLDDNNEVERQQGINMGLQLLRLCSEIWVNVKRLVMLRKIWGARIILAP